MRISQEVIRGQGKGYRVGAYDGGLFQVAEAMRQTRSGEVALTGGRQPVDGPPRGPSQAMAEAMDLSEVRLEKVIELRAAIATGKYRVSAACVADRLLGRLLSGGLLTGRS